MICPFCSANDDKVVDSRASEGGRVIRRRRECLACHKRFTTYERVEAASRLMVVKRDGTRVPFNPDNILASVKAACGKRAIPEEVKQRLVDQVDEEIHHEYEREAPSSAIGQKVLAKLRELDEVAYIRYASEYHQFSDTDQLLEEIEDLQSRPKNIRDQGKLF